MLLAALLGTATLWHAGMAYWPLGLWFFAIAVSMGWVAGPATDSVMGAVPEEKSGVASAMNDVTRQVAGALGTAVIGSLVTSLYGSNVAGSITGLSDAAGDSIGQANAIAGRLPADAGGRLIDSAADAFTSALGGGFLVAAGCAIAAAAAAKLWLPARHRPAVSRAVPEMAIEASAA